MSEGRRSMLPFHDFEISLFETCFLSRLLFFKNPDKFLALLFLELVQIAGVCGRCCSQ